MEGTPGMETGVEVETDRRAFELALGTMVVQTSWVQLEELSPDLLLSSLGYEEEGLQASTARAPGSGYLETYLGT